MKIVSTEHDLRELVGEWRRDGLRAAFVPTMGNLHAGHLRLLEVARRHGDRTVVSIFVNPMQFGAGEDLNAYPRTVDADCEQLRAGGADAVFVPEAALMYPHGLGDTTRVEVPGISEVLCGEFRPGHFTGVATVVAKLFNLVQPQLAVFGEKDFQQLTVIRRMVADLNMPVEVLGVATVREPDGLAMSSRNGYLTADERKRAPLLFETLQQIETRVRAGERDYRALEAAAMERLRAGGFRPEYVSVRQVEDLAPAGAGSGERVVLAAAWLGAARLIDNVRLG